MIICSCNVLSDHDVRSAVTAGAEIPRTAGQVYGCLGCSAQCGRCARTIKRIMSEALGPCAKACCDGCPHSHDKHDAAQPAQHKMPAVAANLDLQIAAA
jgi:bacterioferritin-associated ferredoxin